MESKDMVCANYEELMKMKMLFIRQYGYQQLLDDYTEAVSR